MASRAPWGGPLEIIMEESAMDDNKNLDRAAFPRDLEKVERSWLLRPEEGKKKRYIRVGSIKVSRGIFIWTVRTILAVAFMAGVITLILKNAPRNHRAPDDYTLALNKALMFFNAQKSGKLPGDNNVSWRGDSYLKDGTSGKSGAVLDDLVGGYYDAGDAIKFHFPKAFAMTMLSWSVIEYSLKYEASGELDHVLELIKWGTVYFLKTFNSSADSISQLVTQVGTSEKDHTCWMRPEDIDYPRPVTVSSPCSDVAAEMAAALASASIVFKENEAYAQKPVHGAETLWKISRDHRGRYSAGEADGASFYNSTMYWDELVWGGAWLYYATGNQSYLYVATHPKLAKHVGAFQKGPDYGVLSWDNKLTGAQLLLTRLRMFRSPGFPYEQTLDTYHKQISTIMCSYLSDFPTFNRTREGLIQLNQGRPQPLQYVVNATFLATLFSHYLEVASTPEWYCGPTLYSTDVLRKFAKTQINYILGENPKKLSYFIGFGNRYPERVYHRGASIPKNNITYKCKGGYIWRDSKESNPNTILGAMVDGPHKNDEFQDVRVNYTEPTLAKNAGLVAALVALSGNGTAKLDKSTIFSALEP